MIHPCQTRKLKAWAAKNEIALGWLRSFAEAVAIGLIVASPILWKTLKENLL